MNTSKNISLGLLLLSLGTLQAMESKCAKNSDAPKNTILLTSASPLKKAAQIGGGITLGAGSLGLFGLSALNAFKSIGAGRAFYRALSINIQDKFTTAAGLQLGALLECPMIIIACTVKSGFWALSGALSAFGSYNLLRPFISRS